MRIIAGSARGKKLLTPAGDATRPALARLRESLFSQAADDVEGCRVLDLFAGVGAFGLEALSRGARHVTFVDRSPRALEVLRRNVERLSFQRQATILCGDALRLPELEGPAHAFGIIFMDPPFSMFEEGKDPSGIFRRTMQLLESQATTDSTVLFLRLPASCDPPAELPPFTLRDYGQSRVLVFRRRPSQERAQPASPPS